MNHFVTTKEEEDIPILIGDMPSQRGMDIEEALRRFELQEGSPEFLEDVNCQEEEMVLDDFQIEKSAYVHIRDEEILSFPFKEEDSIDHVTQEETRPTCDEPMKGLKEEESFYDEEIEARSFEAFEVEAPLNKRVIKCSDSQYDEAIPSYIFLQLKNKDPSKA